MRSKGRGSVFAALAASVLATLITFGGAASPRREAAPSRVRREGTRQARRGGGDIAEEASNRVGAADRLGFGAQGERRRIESQPDAQASLPRPVRFREVGGRGLLVKTWVNGAGPYTFALDTGAGATIISRRVAAEARVQVDAGRTMEVGGMSGLSVNTARRAYVRTLALGDGANRLPAAGLLIVADGLPADIDGVLDPTEAFWPLGYVVDLPRAELRAFDPRLTPLRRGDNTAATDGAIVPWLSDGTSRRPFVMLAGGRRALLDTGSNFGLAVTESSARAIGIEVARERERAGVRDIAGGEVRARRIRPATVYVGPLALRRVPTDLLIGAEPDAPVLLGRDALRPFRLTFDPHNRLIQIVSVER